ncbi:pentapeptide repeat-containing protein [Chlorobium phaeovibrioides]|uniref:pentapeptide repeat-containing protein n=1 Tax=Chlorobium phaeovibrioides TaxID=1094 RepID=UPI0037BEF30C
MKFTRIATILMLPAMLMFLSAEATAFNPESLKLLKTDIPGWNTMRSSSPERVMDLYKADLEDAELNRANLSGTILVRADLSGARLDEANLSGSNLAMSFIQKADLKGADLAGSWLNKANLKSSYMVEASLRRSSLAGANLRWARLREADLMDANLTNAILFETDFTNANLRGANLQGATFLPNAILQGATLSAGTILPSGEPADRGWCMRRGARFDQNHTTSHNSIQAPPVELPEETTVLTAPSAETGVSSAGKREQELLRDDVAAWNRLRSSRPEMTVTMKKETLEKTSLRGADLKKPFSPAAISPAQCLTRPT